MQTQTDPNNPTAQSLRLVLIEEHPDVRHAVSKTLMRQLEQVTIWATPYLPTFAAGLLELDPTVIVIGLPQQAVASLETLLDQISVWAAHHVKVVVLAPYFNLDEVAKLRASGVFATLLKTADSAELIQTIQLAADSMRKENSHV